jgi:hypothetical protein
MLEDIVRDYAGPGFRNLPFASRKEKKVELFVTGSVDS